MSRLAERKRGSVAFLLGIAAAALAGCASPPPGCRPADPGPVAPAGNRATGPDCRAGTDVHEALAGLARRFEIGDGVPVDLERAAALYRRAAMASAPYSVIYSPPVRRGGSGRVMRIGKVGSGRGSAEAQFRLGLMHLEGRGVRRDEAAALRLLKAAAAQGHVAAMAALAELVER